MSDQWPAHPGNPGAAPEGSWRYDGDHTALREWQTTLPPQQIPEPEPELEKKPPLALIAAVVVVVAGLAAGSLLVLGNRGGAELGVADEAAYVFMSQAPPPPVFEERGVEGDGAFFPLDVQLAAFSQERSPMNDAERGGRDGSDADGGGASAGGMPTEEEIASGLYGGTAEETCDQERLIEHLMSNPAQGEAWAQVQGIEFSQLPAYIRSLEPRVLAEPTTVLNHGYDGVRQVAFQTETTLEAGTAVLVDENGDVRARCYCGNPVTPKPANHKPPRCLHLAHLVFATPGGRQRDPMGRDVVITGERAVTDTTAWTEVMFAGDVKAWTPDHNVGPELCAPPVVDPTSCAGPGQVPVYGSNDGDEAVGSFNGEVRTAFGVRTANAQVQRAGGTQGAVTEKGRTLVRFSRADVANTSAAWVDVADLGGSDCGPVRVCAEFPGGVRAADGSTVAAPSGPQWADFTGAFPAAADGEMAEVTVTFASGPVLVGADAYQPVADEACRGPQPPVGTCFSRSAGQAVHADAQASTPAQAEVFSARISPTGAVQGDLVEAEIAGTGLVGWFSEAGIDADGSSCRTLLRCAVTNAPLAPMFPSGGTPIDPITEPTLVELSDFYGLNPDDMTERLWHLNVVADDRAGWIARSNVDVISSDPQHCIGDVEGERRCISTIWNDAAGGTPLMLGTQMATVQTSPNADPFDGPRLGVRSDWYGITGFVDIDDELPEGDCLTVNFPTCLGLIGPAYRSYPFTTPVDVEPIFGGGLSELRIMDGGTPHSLIRHDDLGDLWAQIVALPVDLADCGSDDEEEICIGGVCCPDGDPGNCDDAEALLAPVACLSTQPCCVTGSHLPITEDTVGIAFEYLVDPLAPFGVRPIDPGPVDPFEFEGEQWRSFERLQPFGEQQFVVAPLSSLAGSGCDLEAVEPTPTPEPTPTVTPAPAPTSPPGPTPTPRPQPTATPVPTATPEPTPTPEECAEDADGDGICDDVDECIDADLDLHCDWYDNCLGKWNPGQGDLDGDGTGDECDQCPTVPNPDGTVCPLPCPDSNQNGICDGDEPGKPFDPLDLIGLAEADANALAARNGFTTIVASRDGEDYNLPAVFIPDRIKLSISDGRVTGVRVG